MSASVPRLLLLVAALLATAGCSATDDAAVEERRRCLATEAAAAVADDLAGALARVESAFRSAEELLARVSAEPTARFEAMRRLREASGVDGLSWEGPDGIAAWAGRPLDRRPVPSPPPFERTFRSGGVTWHEGPFLSALLVGPRAVAGGHMTATILVEERPPGAAEVPFERRWVRPLGVAAIEVLPPGSAPTHAEDPCSPVATVDSPDGAPLLLVRAQAPGAEATRERMRLEGRRSRGIAWLLLWGISIAAVARWGIRRLPDAASRRLAAGALALLARGALVPMDLPGRFPWLEAAFAPGDFGVSGFLGWLASPADFALSAAAALVAAIAFSAAVTTVRPARRALRVVAGVGGLLAAAEGAALWTALVEAAVAQGQTDWFATGSLIPAPATALMLTALLASTAAAVEVARGVLRLALSAFEGRRRDIASTVALVAGPALAWLLAPAGPVSWSAPLLVLAAAAAARRPPGPSGAGIPSRAILASVLATALLFPALWGLVGERRGTALGTLLDGIVRHEDATVAALRADLEALSGSTRLREGLRAARDGTRPMGLALEVWLGTSLASPGEAGVVAVLDGRGRTIDRFAVAPIPASRLPHPSFPPDGAGDSDIVRARGERGVLRCVMGRLRVRDEEGAVLGGVVLAVPDRLESEIAGLSPSEGASPEEPDAGRFPVSYALLERGSVVSSSDPAVARSRGSFGPPEVTGVSATDSRHAWRTDDEEGLAVWSEERGAVVAARRRTADLGDGVVALARLVLVGVGLGLLAALVLTLAGIRRLRWRLHHKILLSYFLISVIPLAVLGLVSAAEARSRYERGLSERLATDIARVRSDLEAMGPLLFDRAADRDLVRWAAQRRHDLVLWRDGLVSASSRPGLVAAELLPSRLPSEAYAATVLERRETIRREASFAGRPVWFGYAPILDESDRAVATVGVPVLYPEDRIEEELAVTGSVVVAAYLLTLVAVLVGGIYAARRLAGPLDRLAAGTRKVAAGDLAVEIPEAGRDEVGELVQSFNEMTRHLREATARAAKAEREAAWSRMARQVAHEIKNPLTPIRLMIQQLEADVARDPARAAEAIRRTSQVVQRQIESLARIAADFAQFARLPQRRIQEVDPAGLVREVVHLWSGSSAHGVTVSADVPGALPTVAWDEQEMRRVLMNLVANAVQAIPGEGKVTVAGRAESRGGREGVVVAVSDTGVGIPPEALARLFEPDFSTKTSGTGLGLAIVRRILDDLGGEISVDTVVDRGSTFSTWFPRRPPAP